MYTCPVCSGEGILTSYDVSFDYYDETLCWGCKGEMEVALSVYTALLVELDLDL